MLQNRVFSPLASRSGFGAEFFSAFARSSNVFCNSVSADRIVMAASRLLGAKAACVILLSFAAGHRKLYWNGCIVSARVICQRIFPILALVIFLLKLFLQSASKSCFSPLASRFCAWFKCVLQLSVCRSHCNGCAKVAWRYGWVRNTIVSCSWTS